LHQLFIDYDSVKRSVYRVIIGRAKERDHWEDLGVGGNIKLRWTLGK
jgi:hypothetical protein